MKLDLVLCSALLGFSAVEARRHRPRHGRYHVSSSSSRSSTTTTDSSSSSSSTESSFRLDPRTDTHSLHSRFRFDSSSSSSQSGEQVVVVFPPPGQDPIVQPGVVVIEVAGDAIDADNESRAIVAQNEEFKKAFVSDLLQKRGGEDFFDLSSDIAWGSWAKKWNQEGSDDVEVIKPEAESAEAPALIAEEQQAEVAVEDGQAEVIAEEQQAEDTAQADVAQE